MADQNEEIEKILGRMHSLEVRLKRLETALSIKDKELVYNTEQPVKQVDHEPVSNTLREEELGLESRIGRFGLAWLGNIVLLFGITFLAQYMMTLGYSYFSFLFGYLAAAAIFFLAGYLRKTNSHLSFIFRINAQVLLFYITVRLHFFSAAPLIPTKSVVVIMLLLLVGFQVYLSIRKGSQVLAAIAVIFSFCTAVLGDNTNLTLPVVVFTAVGSIYIYRRFNWEPLLIITIFLSYIVFVLWLFGNPLAGHAMGMITEHRFGVVYLLALGASFSIVSFFRQKDSVSDDFLISAIIIN
jgi:hypothetical protein